MDVLSVGCGPTPMLYFAAFTEHTDGAVMVTGSHNPANYNGFKMMLGKKPFFGPAILDLGARSAIGQVTPEAPGSVTKKDVSEAYLARLLQDWGRRHESAEHRLGQRQRLRRRRPQTPGRKTPPANTPSSTLKSTATSRPTTPTRRCPKTSNN